MVARSEEARDGAEQALRLVAPADTLAGSERRLDQRLVFHHRNREIERALKEDGTVGLGEHHRLFGRQVNLSAAGS